jgi:uncharacterized membrane protein YidH (DUF202 family)
VASSELRVEGGAYSPRARKRSIVIARPTWVGAVLVALGMIANLLATLRYAQIRRAIDRGDVGAPGALLVYVFGVTATLVGLAMTMLLLRALGE